MLDVISISSTAEEAIMLGSSKWTHRLYEQITKLARIDVPAIVHGPTGCGKETVALAIHRQSARRHAPFITVPCATIATSTELLSRIDAAEGGTLFLDDIDEAPPETQTHLLRLLQEGKFAHIGEEAKSANVRVIASCQDEPTQMFRQGRLREDLYYRLNVVSIGIPPLSERCEDIEEIAKFYLSCFANTHNRSLRGFSKAALLSLLEHDWPGNVRELVNRVQRAVLLAQGRFIQPEDLDLVRPTQRPLLSLEEIRAAAESEALRRALSQSRNRVSRAAALLGVSRVTLYRLMDKYQLRTGTDALIESEAEEEIGNPA